MNNAFQKLMEMLDKLEKARISYSLSRIREDSVLILVAAPGERWEVEVMGDGSIEIEVFRSDGRIFHNEEKFNELLGYYAERLTPAPAESAAEESSERPQADDMASPTA
jgi:hypothetical protein